MRKCGPRMTIEVASALKPIPEVLLAREDERLWILETFGKNR